MSRPLRWTARILAVLLGIFVLVQAWFYGHVLFYKHRPPGETAFMSHQLAGLQEKNPRAAIRYQWVPYDRISDHLKRAMIAAEDARFVEHEGFDWEGIQNALDKNWKRGKTVAGGSTITQQLAKNLFLGGERSLPRKAQEFVITFMLEALLSKQRILEIYLNNVEWGEGVFGADAAARHYFHVAAGKLGAMQSAQLAVMLPAPKRFEKRPGSAYVVGRAATVVARMSAVEIP